MVSYAGSQTAGNNLLLINGHPVSINFFALLRTLRVERAVAEDLVKLGVKQNAVAKVLEAMNKHSHQYIGIEGILKTGKQTGRIYLNDLEKDAKYALWSKDVTTFLYNFGSEFSEVAFNLLNLIVVVDLDTTIGWNIFLASFGLYTDNWPFRLGYILLGEPEKVIVLSHALKMLRADYEASREEFFALLKTARTAEDIAHALTTACPECKIDWELTFLHERPADFCRESGVCGPADFILNGRLLEVATEDWRADLLRGIRKEREIVQYLVFSGYAQRLGTDFFEEAVYMKTVDRVNKAITAPLSTELEIQEPPEWGFLIGTETPALVTFTVIASAQDLHFVQMTLDALFRFSHLGFRFRYLLEMQEVPNEWLDTLCRLYLLLYRRLEIAELQTEIHAETECVAEELESLLTSSGNDPVLLVNSRVIPMSKIHSPLDFNIAYTTETRRLGLEEVAETLADEFTPGLLEKLAFAVLSRTHKFPSYELYATYPIPAQLLGTSLAREFPATGEQWYSVQALLNPMSEEAQLLVQLLAWLQGRGGANTIVLNPDIELQDKVLPVHRHFQLLIRESFDDHLRIGHKSEATFTLKLVTEPSWVARLEECKLDADNLIPSEDITVVYALRSLLVVGHCAHYYNDYQLEPPNGLQLELTGKSYRTETIVMKNFGYFQFKATPGAFQIDLVEGRSKELFTISKGSTVELNDIQLSPHIMQVEKKPEMENEELLEASALVEKGGTIHVFSLASGKLYERLIRIMMVSAVSNTKNRVKFWLLEDFFSPGFSDYVSRLAKALNFDYEFVSYSWPQWLFGQKEKQRLIWGYKILFLDVLFPLSVNRVIYIDADQVVRADLKELWEMDLEGAPYAYVPFCDSNSETEGYRFWKHGYWKNLLGDLPYHISALYVVDLAKFRSMAAGDYLRYYYESMAPNPNSLANLDQDLPNFAQFQLPIFSLPQEWLWCATWCSEDTKQYAKTIDLCNNPQTKEPKIEAAKRIVSEWTFLDESIQKFLNENSSKLETYRYKEDL